MEISNGRKARGWLAILYGPAGEGKTTFAATAKGALFLDLERGTDFMDVSRVGLIGTVEDTLREIYRLKDSFSTLVVDSYTALEKLSVKDYCDKHKIETIEAFDRKDFGRATKEWRKSVVALIDNLRAFNAAGKNVLLVAHSKSRYQTDVISQVEYERLEFDSDKELAPTLMSMVDGCFLLRKKAIVTEGKALGTGARVLHTSDKPHYLAKSRWQLADSIENPSADFWSKLDV
jgi:hypothetical protein